MRKFQLLLIFSLIIFLTACGGGGGGSKSTPLPEESLTTRQQKASRFLAQSTFGATEDDINELSQTSVKDYNQWITDQMALSQTKFVDILKKKNEDEYEWNEHINAWLSLAMTSKDQLRHRVAFALSQILVVSDQNGLDQQKYGLANYWDILAKHSFGNFRDLMTDVTLSPVMGEYLSMKGNEKPNFEENIRPDENYARELMQLFTIGLYMLNKDGTPKLDSDGNKIPTYDQDIVVAYAHVFTGWNFAGLSDWYEWKEDFDYESPMEAYPDFHDMDSHTLLQGKVLPANKTPREALDYALDTIFDHPNVGPFISKQLIQKLVTSNPTPAYVKRVTKIFNNNGKNVKGDLGAVVRAILMDDEARNGHLKAPTIYGKLREPLLRVTGLWRAFHGAAATGKYEFSWILGAMKQAPLEAPSVFNFYSPTFSQPGPISDAGYLSPEFQMYDESATISMTNNMYALIYWRIKGNDDYDIDTIVLDLDEEIAMVNEVDKLLDKLNLIIMAGTMSTELRDAVKEMIMEHGENSGDWHTSMKVADAIFLMLNSPEAIIQK